MQHDHVLKKLKFDLLTLRSGVGVCEQNSCYHVATFCDSNIFDMQHDHVLKKWNFDLLILRSCGRGESVGKYLLPFCYISRLHFIFYAT